MTLSRTMSGARTLLGVFAHPDDESFGPGGTLAKYADEGANVHVIIATDGVAGSVEESFRLVTHSTLAQARAEELANAVVALGITSVWSLPYRDSGMRNTPENEHPDALVQQPIETLTDEICKYIERLKPQVIVTHDPFGGYGHPDHVRVSEVVTAAFHRFRQQFAGREESPWPNKLYYTAFDKRMLKLTVRFMSLMGKDPTRVGRNQDINLVEISQWHNPIHATVDVSAYLGQKMAASVAHVSQYSGGPSYIRYLPGFVRRRLLMFDSFTRAFPVASELTSATRECDLFAGIM